MDSNGYQSFERSLLITELSRGAELAKQLRAQMGPEYSIEIKETLLQQIETSYDKALFILGCGDTFEQPHQLLHVPSLAMPSTPLSAMESPKIDDRSVQDCWATKQVQRSDDDPTVLQVTYKGKHTCDMTRRSKSAPTTPAKQEPKSDDFQITEYQQDSDIILSFQNGMGADVHGFPFSCFNGEIPNILPSTNNFTNSFYGSFSPSLISPADSDSNFFSMPPFKMETIDSVQHQQQNLEGDITEIHSSATSVTNSPTIDPNFSLDPWSFRLNFPFNNQ